jgi:hypothetical protein
MLEVEKENSAPLDSLPDMAAACPLPANTYQTAARAQETVRHQGTTGAREYGYIPEAYGQQAGGEASVTRHLARRRAASLYREAEVG